MDNSDLGSRSFSSHPRSVFPGSAAWENPDLRSVLSVISDLGHFSREKSDLGAGRSVFTDISDLRSVFSKVPFHENSDLGRAETDLAPGQF